MAVPAVPTPRRSTDGTGAREPSGAPPFPRRVEVAGARIDACTMEEAVHLILQQARRGGAPEYVVTPNAHHIVMLSESAEFRAVYRDAWLSLADGMALVWACRFLGTPVPEKVSGSDLFPALCAAAAGTGIRIFLLGGRPGAADGAAAVLRNAHPGLEIAGTYSPPFGFEHDASELDRIGRMVREAAPHVLFVGLGAPKQENFIRDHRERLGVPVSVGIGVSFEFVAGMVTRAPRWMRGAGLEWLHRLAMEPRRLWKRYAVTNPRFVRLVLQQRARARGGTPSAS